MNTASPGLSLDLDKVLGLEPEPATPVTTAVATQASIVTTQGPQAMVCRDMLDDKTRDAVAAHAKTLLQPVLSDDNLLGTLGNEAVEEINALVQKLLGDIGRAANIKELTALTGELDDRLRGFTRKYGNDDKIKQARDHYENAKGKFLDLFNRFRNELHMLLKDAKGIQSYLDGLKADLIERQGELRLNVTRCNQLYAANEVAIQKLVAWIAIMEFLRDDTEAYMNSIVVDDSDPQVREKRELRDRVAQVIQQLDVRLGEFKQRLFVAWATSPQIRNIRSISWGLAQRMGLLVNLTIPVFELTVVQWAMALEADEAAKTAEAVGQTTDHAMEAWAQAAGQMIPAAAAAIQAPSMSPDAIVAVAESLRTQAEGFVTAYRDGMQKRAANERAIMQAAQLIAESQDKAAEQVRQLVAGAVTSNNDMLALPPAPELPEVVLAHSDEVLAGQLVNQ